MSIHCPSHPCSCTALSWALAGLLCFALTAHARPVGTDVSPDDSLVLVRNHATVYRIIIDHRANAGDRRAAVLLQATVQRMTDARMPIDSVPPRPEECVIWIGAAGRCGSPPVPVQWSDLQEDGFLVTTSGTAVVIAGGTDKGALYGVCSLLERFGCRRYSPAVDVVPRRSDLVLAPLHDRQVPVFRFRDAHFYDPAYMEWHGLDNHEDIFGMYVHTFRQLVPPERWFASHPEYFSLTPGGRTPDGQLCLTNPDVFRIVVEELQQRMRRAPDARFWSVSQNDTYTPCCCAACRRIDSLEGSPSGSLLAFVNRVAERFPDKIISTLAYQYTRKAPAHLSPAKNVNIMLCSIECNRSTPLADDPSSASFRRDVEDWTLRTDNIYLWDYVVQFRNLISPFPNLRVLQPNIRYFARSGITALFEQGSGRWPNEFKELRTYLIAKLLWNPDVNADSVMNDFLAGFYGAAAPHLRRAIDVMHDSLAASGEDLVIYGYPRPSSRGFLSPACLDEVASCFDRAEAAVAGDAALLDRVRTARLPLQFALLEQAKILGTGPRGFFESVAGVGPWRPRADMEALLKLFVERCNHYGIAALDESGTTPAHWQAVTRQFLDESMQPHLALSRQVRIDPPASTAYHGGEAQALTDGLKGWNDYHMHWLGFEGTDMSAVIDFEETLTLRSVQLRFLQDNNSWVFLPTAVEYAVSDDGAHFRTIASQALPAREKENGAFVHPVAMMCEPVRARFLRIIATNRGTCPPWHKGAGGKAWIFADEIEVR
jgi:hypothetical protein